MKRIVVIGSYNTGLTMFVDRLPSLGETILATDYHEGPGGKGSNQAIAAKRLGGLVEFVGCVGKDRYGEAALDLWRSEGLGTGYVKRVNLHTGVGFVIVDRNGGNIITVDPGANMQFTKEDVDKVEELIAGAGVLLLQLEMPIETVMHAAKVGKKNGVIVILNPAPARRLTTEQLSSIDVLTPNEAEFAMLSGERGRLRLGDEAERLIQSGVGAVIITLGEKGARVTTADEIYNVRAPKVKVIDPTGAGDAFSGALAVALSEGTPLRQAVAFANYAGALTVTKREVIPALPRREEVEEFRKNHSRP